MSKIRYSGINSILAHLETRIVNRISQEVVNGYSLKSIGNWGSKGWERSHLEATPCIVVYKELKRD